VTGKASGLLNLLQSSPKVLFQNKWMKKTKGEHDLPRFTWKMAIETRAVELGFKNLGFRFLEI